MTTNPNPEWIDHEILEFERRMAEPSVPCKRTDCPNRDAEGFGSYAKDAYCGFCSLACREQFFADTSGITSKRLTWLEKHNGNDHRTA